MTDSEPCVDLPEPGLLCRQSDWLAPARAQLLRQAHVARRKRVLDLGTGYGAVVPELVRRSAGCVVALDRALVALQRPRCFSGAERVAADAANLPFSSDAYDLAFTQMTLLWATPLPDVATELWRVLMPGGVLVALEPDFGGMIEYPPEIDSRPLWLSGLERAGADPAIGRRLPGVLARQGFDVKVSLFDTLFEPDPARFAFLRGLPLTDEERRQLDRVERASDEMRAPWCQVAHLPFFLIRANKP